MDERHCQAGSLGENPSSPGRLSREAPRHINPIDEGVSTAQRSNSLVQSINQRFPSSRHIVRDSAALLANAAQAPGDRANTRSSHSG